MYASSCRLTAVCPRIDEKDGHLWAVPYMQKHRLRRVRDVSCGHGVGFRCSLRGRMSYLGQIGSNSDTLDAAGKRNTAKICGALPALLRNRPPVSCILCRTFLLRTEQLSSFLLSVSTPKQQVVQARQATRQHILLRQHKRNVMDILKRATCPVYPAASAKPYLACSPSLSSGYARYNNW